MSDRKNMKLFALNSNQEIAQKIAQAVGVPLGKLSSRQFSDGEIQVNIEESVRGYDVYIIQSTSFPVNNHLMELLIMVDACVRASAHSINVVLPYFGYARQDRIASPREPLTAKLVANMLVKAGVDRVLTLDLHAVQVQGFFDIPVDNIYATPILTHDASKQHFENLIVVSPDIGGVVRARAVAKMLNCDLAIIDKRRPKANVAEVMNIIGDVSGKTCLMVDDMIDTANTLCKAASALKERGAERVLAYATHPVFSGAAIERLNSSDIDQVVVTDSIPLSDAARVSSKIRQVSIAGLLAETIRRISNEESVSYLFNEDVASPGALFLP